ncbi:Type IV pilus assembly protein PilM [Hyella patelloides LEGE 07179]|uniref:Type IV pilus assembly protein PilM n=1 Tax=Hyella patelloides LEGE 07179 TaxID=945734 RepID=A0A563VJ08_9CYAN|nr:type IV pilus assembly protein PilM [Hyella patelloides]VEP11373.1 Type IV pilus assembly protein PilM [Hyella patelloides LEGE 07179]
MINKLTNLFAKSSDVVGIEINPEKINITQIVKQGQQYKLQKNVSALMPDGVYEGGEIVDSLSLSELIKDTFQQNRISAKQVITAVPMREAIIRIIPVPAELDEEELKDMIMVHEAGMHLPYPREEVDLDYVKLGYFMDEDGIEKVNVLLVATKKEVTDLYLEIFEQAELKVKVLEINSFALIRTIKEQLRQFGSQEAVVLVDIEFDSTEIAIIVEGVPQFSRTVPIGTYQMQNALSQGMGSPDEDIALLHEINLLPDPQDGDSEIHTGTSALLKIVGELADELGRSINFYLNQSDGLEIAQLIVAGPGASIQQIDEFFTQRLNLPAMPVDPIAALAIEVGNSVPQEERSGLGIALGLGMRDLA